MPLFLDRIPLYSWVNPRSGVRLWSFSVLALATPPTVSALTPSAVQPQRWVIDTAFTGDAYAWRSHVEEAGLQPALDLAGSRRAQSAFGEEDHLPVCKASLWLISNIPAVRDTPFRLALNPGMLFRNAPAPDAESHRPLLGLRALLRARLKVQIDFDKATASIWTPGPWHQSCWLLLRRVLSGYARVPPPW